MPTSDNTGNSTRRKKGPIRKSGDSPILRRLENTIPGIGIELRKRAM